MKWRILLSDFRCRKKHRGQVGERRHQTILILILIQDHMYTGFFLGFMFITWVTPTSRQHISFLLKRLTHPIDLTKLNRTPVIGCGVLLAGRMTAWCSVIQLVVTWIVKEPSPIKQATVSVLCPVLFLPFALFFVFRIPRFSLYCDPKKLQKCDRREWLRDTSNPGSGCPGFKAPPVALFLRQGTLLHFVSLHPGE